MSKKSNRYDNASTFVGPAPADADWRPLKPAEMPAAAPGPATTPGQAIVISSEASKSFTSVQGSHRDRQKALERKYIAVIAIEAATIGGLMLLGYLQARSNAPLFGAGWLALTGVASLATILWLNGQDNAHSPSGVERQRNQLTADVATETHEATVEAWKTVELARIEKYYGYLETSDERRYNARQLPKRD